VGAAEAANAAVRGFRRSHKRAEIRGRSAS